MASLCGIENTPDDRHSLRRAYTNGFIKIHPAVNRLAAPLCHATLVMLRPTIAADR
jgi:hypothetical protein